ncbi:MAG: MlaD family protein [Candidatus Cloacimonadota bacterium]|nr:MlaD family protein [Candidatus Cloacimonadota bacterium]
MFSKTITIHTYFNAVQGLRSGNHVRFSGIIIGTIGDLKIVTDTSVQVDMSIDKKMIKFVRKDSKAEIKPEALIGDKMVIIHSGTADYDQVADGDYLESNKSVHFEAIFHEVTKDLKKTMEIIANLVDITDKVNVGDGNVGRLLNDSSIAIKLDKSADNFLVLTDNLKELSEQLNNPNSDVGKLIYRSDMTTRIDSILINVDNITATTALATRNLSKATAELSITAEAINSGNGAIQKLLYDSAFADTLGYTLDNLNKTLIEFDKVAKNLQHKKLFGGKKEKEDK